MKRNENVHLWCGAASETGRQRSVVIVRQATGPPGASCHCSVHLRIMAYREEGNGIVREVNEDREGLRLHPVTEPDHLSVCVHV